MHPIQNKILTLLKDQGSTQLKYREIGRKIGESHPQTVKHHLEVLLEKNLVVEQNGFIRLNRTERSESSFIDLPFYGLASCGNANALAEDQAEGFIKISKNFFPRGDIADYFLVRAEGNSMNRAHVGTQDLGVDDGDLVIVNHRRKEPQDGDYILSVVDDYANIKAFKRRGKTIELSSESSDEYFPILIDEGDNYHVLGEVIDVIKMQKKR